MSTIDIQQLNTEQLNALIKKAKAKTSSVNKAQSTERKLGESYPVSPSQQSVWLVSQDAKASAAYNITMHLLVKGPLDLTKLGHALDGVIQRHATLRTGYRFDSNLGQAVQFLCEAEPKPLNVQRFDDVSDWLERASCQNNQPLDFQQGEVYRTTVAKLNEQEHILSLEFHHIAFDGWSTGILLNELRAFYLDQQQDLDMIAKDYIDVAGMNQEIASKDALNYWQQKLSNSPVTRLPADVLPSSDTKAFQGAVVRHNLPDSLASALSARGQALGMSNFMLFSAALQYLVGRYNDTQESVIGSYVSGRDKTESQSLIGCFVNNIVLRQAWCESDNLHAFLDISKRTGLEALANQSAPFPEVVKSVGWQSEGHPIYQIGLVMQPDQVSLDSWGELEISALEAESSYAHMDLEIYVWPKGDAFELVLNYDSSRYTKQRIQWLADHYEQVLRSFATAPLEQPLQSVEIVTSQEQAILKTLDRRKTDQPDMLSELVARLDSISDSHTAMVLDGQVTSYGSLKQRILLWLETFRNRQLQRGERVAFWGERGLEQQAVLVACSVFGVAYVPLDRSLPEVRCQQIINDACPTLLIFEEGKQPVAAFSTQAEILTHDALTTPVSNFTAMLQIISPRASLEEFAVLYTSGTTGVPKGVSISVGAANARLNFARNTLTTLSSDRVLQRTPLGFVDALWEVLDTVMAAATSIVAQNNEVASGSLLAELVNTQQVSKLYAVPSLLRMLCMGEHSLPTLRHIYSTAEPFSLTLLSEVQETCPEADVFNLYGSTEVNDIAWHKICAESVTSGYLGQIVEGARIDIVDQFGRLMPIGCPGEIELTGQQKLLGYTHHQTPAEESDNGQQGAFKMRDLAAVLPSGQVRLIGRKDGMVKIRGNRVEVLEVQMNLRESTGDSGAVVYFSRQYSALIGCWSGSNSPQSTRERLLDKLPAYMVPSQLYCLSQIPLLPHGKVNMPALEQLVEAERSLIESQAPAEKTEHEKALEDIYASVLQVNACDIDKNVFDLGFSSLELNQVQHQVTTTLDKTVDVVTLLKYPTIRSLAQHLFGSKDLSTNKPARRGQRTSRVRRRTK